MNNLVICPAMFDNFYNIVTDDKTYSLKKKDFNLSFRRQLGTIVESRYRGGILTKKERHFLIPKACGVLILYFLHKIHKEAQNPPGQPIVSGINSVTSRIGKYIDF